MYKAYRFRLYPNKDQKEIINKTFGTTRLLYNYYLNQKQELYKNEHKNISIKEMIKDIPNLYLDKPFLKEVDGIALRCSIFDLEDSYQKFFKEKKGYPKYKRKFDKNSYRTNCIRSTYKGNTYENIKLDLKNRTITLPKLRDMKIRGYRKLKNISGRIINATVSREKDGRYYVSILYDEEMVIKPVKLTKIIGIDVGIKDLVITSDYKKYENEKVIEKFEKRIKRYQKRLSKKVKGSRNYYKLKQKLARLYTKIKNARKYRMHKITKEIVEENDIIVTETLKIKNMIQNLNLVSLYQMLH